MSKGLLLVGCGVSPMCDGSRETVGARRRAAAPTGPRRRRTAARTGGCPGRRRTSPSGSRRNRDGSDSAEDRRPAVAAEPLLAAVLRLPHAQLSSPATIRNAAGSRVRLCRCGRAGAPLASLAVAVARPDERLGHLVANGAAVTTAGERQLRHRTGGRRQRSISAWASFCCRLTSSSLFDSSSSRLALRACNACRSATSDSNCCVKALDARHRRSPPLLGLRGKSARIWPRRRRGGRRRRSHRLARFRPHSQRRLPGCDESSTRLLSGCQSRSTSSAPLSRWAAPESSRSGTRQSPGRPVSHRTRLLARRRERPSRRRTRASPRRSSGRACVSPTYRYSGWPAYVTCCVPSARRIFPSSDCFTPARATGAPWVSSGGQYCAQGPEHALRRLVSFSNR